MELLHPTPGWLTVHHVGCPNNPQRLRTSSIVFLQNTRPGVTTVTLATRHQLHLAHSFAEVSEAVSMDEGRVRDQDLTAKEVFA